MGFTRTFCDYMSQFYALWFAVVMKQVVKDPIHKLKNQICFFHLATLALSGSLTAVLSFFNTFGVQEDLSCGIMFTPGLDDEILMIVPFLLVFIQMYCIRCITKETPFIIRESVRTTHFESCMLIVAETIREKVHMLHHLFDVYAMHAGCDHGLRI